MDRVVINASRYTSWIVETSPLALAGLVALTVPISAIWGARAGWRAPLLFAFTAAGHGIDLPRLPVLHGLVGYLRFLLPAWPALWLGAAVLLVGATTRWRAAFGLGILITLVTGVAGIQLFTGTRHLQSRRGTWYVSVANLVAASTEPNAVILTWQHSGTVRALRRAGDRALRPAGCSLAGSDHCVAPCARATPERPGGRLGTATLP